MHGHASGGHGRGPVNCIIQASSNGSTCSRPTYYYNPTSDHTREIIKLEFGGRPVRPEGAVKE